MWYKKSNKIHRMDTIKKYLTKFNHKYLNHILRILKKVNHSCHHLNKVT